ncbi:MAG TPA: hypothetical protein VGH27_36360 [Streptosporangiaceae bacterium]|jgi:hypothetical protein
MNDLLYKARMALKDSIEANVSTPGHGRVYVTFFPHFFWEGATQEQRDQAIRNIFTSLRDLGMDLDGGDSAIPALLESEPVEIVALAA